MAKKLKPPHERLADVDYYVAATHYEYFALWKRYSEEWGKEKDWEQEATGFATQIGECDGRPVNLAFIFAKIKGKRVAFYEVVSQVADYALVDIYLENVPRKTDAWNFHHCLHWIDDNV